MRARNHSDGNIARRRARSPLLATTAFALLGGCAVGPDFVPSEAPENAGYARGRPGATASTATAGGASQRLRPGRDVPGEWWRLFHSRQLSALVEEAVSNHPDLDAAEAALRQARETVAADESSFAPSVSPTNSITRQQISPALYGNSGSGAGTAAFSTRYTLFNSNIPVSFTPDVFGKTIRTVEADAAAAEYQRYQLEAAYLALTANVVTAAITDAAYADQIKATQTLIADYQTQLDILQKRFELGAVSLADVSAERTLLAQAQATLPPLQKARAQTRNQLMAYLGRLPNDDRGEAISLQKLNLPRDLPLSVPSNLVRQRPDIMAAESKLHQASAQIGVATANMLPQLTLTGQVGSLSLSFPQLYTPQTMAYSLSASVAGKLFDGGVLAHQREAQIAAYDQAAAQYKSTVISAFRNVGDALQAIKHDANALRAEAAAEKAAAQSLDIARIQYRAGSTTYTTVLASEQALLNARLNRVKAQAARYADTTALLQALGGGWWNRIDETPASLPKPTDLISTSPIAAAIRAETEENSNAR